MTPLAKPSGIALQDHRQHVYDEARRLLGALPFLEGKYRRLLQGADLRRAVLNAAWYHDDGKEHRDWQEACRKDYEHYQAWRVANGLTRDGLDPNDYDRYRSQSRGAGQHLRISGIRHEFDSLRRYMAKAKTTKELAERVAIAAHHGTLGFRHSQRWREDGNGAFAGLWAALSGQASSAPHHAPNLARYELAGVRSLLRLADGRASRAEGGGELPELMPFQYACPYPPDQLREVQRLAVAHADDPVTVLRAPTGSGKTDAALLWGQAQVAAGRADRLVIAMPTRFTSNALALNVAESLANTGLYHSSAWHARYGGARGAARDSALEQHKLARYLATPATVCTVDHLLIALSGTREDHYTTGFFLANSAVVFDEVDFYDPFVQANLVVLLDALRQLKVPALLMSATVPSSNLALYNIPGPIRHDEGAHGGERLLHVHAPVARPEDAADVLQQMVEAGTGIVYANTVERAYLFFKWFSERTDDVVLYHSRFTEPHKQEVEADLLARLGREAWKVGQAHGIAVLTQIGEMSVNVSAPLMYSDLCPWDRLAQRLGRLARFRAEIPRGEAWVAPPVREGSLYPPPYGSYRQGTGWTPGEPLVQTNVRLAELARLHPGGIPIHADLLVSEVEALYPAAPVFDDAARENQRLLRNHVERHWLMPAAAEVDDDTGSHVGGWRSRDIEPQTTLLVCWPEG
ncbi:MAG TPA: CRISPR-associated helicase Cas3', partial [Rhodothermales bacterium]|nr:CRISPR-associated helicase Cas3' [Rhodothermales bacterium]